MSLDYIIVLLIFVLFIFVVVFVIYNRQNTVQIEQLKQLLNQNLNQNSKINEDLKSTQTEIALSLQDVFIDRFYMLSSSLNGTHQNMQNIIENKFGNIDEKFNTVAQKIAGIEHLSNLKSSVDELNKIFSSNKLRGTFGEIELEKVLSFTYGENSDFYELQKQLSNGKIADCVLHVGNGSIVCIDSKFPLENFNRMNVAINKDEINFYKKEFEKNIKKHIIDISQRYIIPPFTLEYAIVFIPAEAVYIKACSMSILEFGLKHGVFIASPSTLMALIYSLKLLYKDISIAKHIKELRLEFVSLLNEFSSYESSKLSMQKSLQKASNELSNLDNKANLIISKLKKLSTQGMD